jgi:hypothetical protein
MSTHYRLSIAAGLLVQKVNRALLTFLFPSWFGRDRKYRPEKYYMRGPGPKWRAKHLSKSAASGRC